MASFPPAGAYRIAEFLQNCFGPAKEPVREFYEMLTGDRAPLLCDDTVGRMYRLLADARKRTADAATLARLDVLTGYVRYVELWLDYSSATGPARQSAFEALIRHAWKIRVGDSSHEGAVPRPAEPRQGRDGADGASWNAPEKTNPWKAGPERTRADYEKFAADGIANRKLLDFTPVRYTDDLVPAAPLKLADATDGERVVAFFGKGGLHCFAVDGQPLWSKELGAFPGEWGTAASPVIVGNLVIQNCDAAGEGLLVAFDKTTGNEAWRTPRTAPERGGWTTPVLVKAGDKQELVLIGEKAVTGYDPTTGKELWHCTSFSGRGEPTVTPGPGGLLFVVSGQPGDIFAVRPGGRGDVTRTHMAWHTPRKSGRDRPSPILAGNFMVVASMSGLATCYDAPTGKTLWSERLKGSFSSSPVAAGGRVFFQNETGDTTVIEPGPELKVVAENKLGAKGEVFRASLIPCGGQWFTRSDKATYCIGGK